MKYIAKTYTTYNDVDIYNYESCMDALDVEYEEIEERYAKRYDKVKKYLGKTEITRYFKIDTKGFMLWQEGVEVWHSSPEVRYDIKRELVFNDNEIQFKTDTCFYVIAENVEETINKCRSEIHNFDELVEDVLTSLNIDYTWHLTKFEINKIKMYIKKEIIGG